MAGKRKDIAGHRYGRRVAVRFAFQKKFPSGGTMSYWEFKCDCGNSGTASISQLKNSESCGCKQREVIAQHVGKRNRITFGLASFNNIYNGYKNRARRKQIEFNLTDAEFRKLTSSNCHYCGVEPQQYTAYHKRKCFGVYVYNGIDRIDNAEGYVTTNCVPCCGICNKAKRDLTYEEFTQWLDRLTKYWNQQN
jgi:hypothetical protein